MTQPPACTWLRARHAARQLSPAPCAGHVRPSAQDRCSCQRRTGRSQGRDAAATRSRGTSQMRRAICRACARAPAAAHHHPVAGATALVPFPPSRALREAGLRRQPAALDAAASLTAAQVRVTCNWARARLASIAAPHLHPCLARTPFRLLQPGLKVAGKLKQERVSRVGVGCAVRGARTHMAVSTACAAASSARCRSVARSSMRASNSALRADSRAASCR